MRYFYLILIAFVFVACNPNKKNIEFVGENNKDIDSILVTYFCGDFDSDVAIRCEKIARIQANHPINDYSSPHVEAIDTFIVDKSILIRIKLLLEKNKKHKNLTKMHECM